MGKNSRGSSLRAGAGAARPHLVAQLGGARTPKQGISWALHIHNWLYDGILLVDGICVCIYIYIYMYMYVCNIIQDNMILCNIV